MREAFFGVDVGGTWLRAAAVDKRGTVLRRARLPAPARSSLPDLVKALARRWRLEPAAIVVASTGSGSPRIRRQVAQALRSVAPHARAITDLDLAWRRALGGPGVLILAGTGSLAYGRDARGRSARVGGLGPMLGDEGSAFWIGREWLRGRPHREALVYAHRERPQAAIASLAARVLEKARGSSAEARRARRIIAQAQGALALQVRACASLLRLPARLPLHVSWHGGLMDHAGFRAGVLRRLGRSVRATPPDATPPEVIAARLSIRGR